MDNKKRRDKRNKDIVSRLKRGESTRTVPPEATWWPPRPIIKKDPEAIKRLYNSDPIDSPKQPTLKLVDDEEDESQV